MCAQIMLDVQTLEQ